MTLVRISCCIFTFLLTVGCTIGVPAKDCRLRPFPTVETTSCSRTVLRHAVGDVTVSRNLLLHSAPKPCKWNGRRSKPWRHWNRGVLRPPSRYAVAGHEHRGFQFTLALTGYAGTRYRYTSSSGVGYVKAFAASLAPQANSRTLPESTRTFHSHCLERRSGVPGVLPPGRSRALSHFDVVRAHSRIFSFSRRCHLHD